MRNHSTPFEIAKAIASNFEPKEEGGSRYLYTFTGTAQLFLEFTDDLLLSNWRYEYDPSDKSKVCYFGIGSLTNRSFRHKTNNKRKIFPPQDNRIILRSSLSTNDVFELEMLLVARFGKLFHGGVLANESDGGSGCTNRIFPETWYSDHEQTLLANASWYYLIDEQKTIIDEGTANGLGKKYGIDQGAVAGIARGRSHGAWHEKLRQRLIFCLKDDYESFVVQDCPSLREIVIVTPNGVVDVGLGRELTERYGLSNHIHRAANPSRAGRTIMGNRCYYKDECPKEILARLSI